VQDVFMRPTLAFGNVPEGLSIASICTYSHPASCKTRQTQQTEPANPIGMPINSDVPWRVSVVFRHSCHWRTKLSRMVHKITHT